MENYVKVKKIGEGSFGKALLVKRKHDGKQCVVKEIGISKMSSKEREESKKEVKVLSQLKHPNIVSYLESFQGDGNLYIVMDYCEAGDLYQHIVKQRGIHMDETKVLDIFVQCCLAIKHIHDRKILHRDIKTQNIFLTKHFIVKLGDFGIARVLKSTMELARTCIGTPYYLSPEIVENRPYNNKSDIWSLGCVLYELATLKHAFEAGNMKNLVMKIVRGSYPPVPNRYSFELRSLVAQCFKRSPTERPSINSILKKPIIQQRIAKYLSPEELESEFSHTVLHREKFNMAKPYPSSRPPSVAVLKKPPAGKRLAGPAAVYGVSVAKKPVPVRKPLSVLQAAARQKKSSEQVVKNSSDKRREIDARERRRKQLLSQEQQYQDYMAKIQKQRWDKQQIAHMNRAREVGWKNVLSSDEKKLKVEIPQAINAAKNKDVMKKYQPQANIEKHLNKQHPQYEQKQQQQQHAEEKPVAKPINAWQVSEEAKHNAFKAEDAAERARVLEEFWQRKKEAAAYKARGNQDMYGRVNVEKEENPLLQFHIEQMAAHKKGHGRNKLEVDYLKQLEAIRKQNYVERKNLQCGGDGKLYVHKNENIPDPRYDPDARRRKIEALKEQAEQRSAMLRQQLELRKKQVEERIEKERQQRLKERKNQPIAKQVARPLPKLNEKEMKKEKIVTPAVGLETAMNQVVKPKLFRSCSEGDLADLVKPVEKVQRKNWGGVAPVQSALANMPLEITSSAMEATTAGNVEPNTNPSKDMPSRRQWLPDGKTQFVSMLHNIELSGTQMPTMTIKADQEHQSSNLRNNGLGKIGETIILSSKPNHVDTSKTITISNKKEELVEKIATSVAENKTIVISKNIEIENNSDLLKNESDDKTTALQQSLEHVNISLEEKPESVKEDEELIDISKNETKKFVGNPPKAAWADDEDEKKEIDANVSRESDDSFHTPNRMVGLQTGCYDIEKKLLRTCSLPDLRNNAESPVSLSISLEREKSVEANGEELASLDDNNENDSNECVMTDINNDDEEEEEEEEEKVGETDDGDEEEEEEKVEETDDGDEEEEEEEDEELQNEECFENDDEEEIEDFESMLESMRDVLKSTAHSPVSTTVVDKDDVKQDDKNSEANINADDAEDDNDVWESENEDDENSKMTLKPKEKDAKLKETLFSRIEESRKALEDELGLDLFVKIYKHVQTIQDNEDDELQLDTVEVSELLGDKEFLYQKIVYLVMADNAYCEGNDGVC